MNNGKSLRTRQRVHDLGADRVRLNDVWSEFPDDLDYPIADAIQQPCDFPVWEALGKLGERYLNGDLLLHVHYVEARASQLNRGPRYCARIRAAVGLTPSHGEVRTGSNFDNIEDERAMLIRVIQGLQNGERCVVTLCPSEVRLAVLNGREDVCVRDAFYLSLVSGHILPLGGLKPEDWELGFVGRRPAVFLDQQACHMVKRGPKLEEDFSGNDADMWRDDPNLLRVAERLCRWRITIADKAIRLRCQEVPDMKTQFSEVLIGPL